MTQSQPPVKILTDHLKGVSSVYSGKHGCACGCRGNHTSNPRTIKQIVGKIQQAVIDGHQLEVWPGVYFAVNTETRTYVAYTDGRTH